ncbi:MAG: hypothetical protein KFKLKKLM_01558 [Flavobacteriales bacterium]|nr:hypothetical protein [Flavobacteriales bacterium]
MLVRKKKMGVAMLVVLILGLTILRENIFLEINAIIDGYEVNKANFYLFYDVLNSYPVEKLGMLKWVLSISFIFVIALTTFFALHLWFKKKQYDKITMWFYFLTFILIALLVVFTKVFGVFDNMYFILKKIISFLQSPLPLFILFSVYFYITKSADIPNRDK